MPLEGIGHAYTYGCDALGCQEKTQVAFQGSLAPPFPPVPEKWVMVVDGSKDSFYGHIYYFCPRHDSVDLLGLDTLARQGEGQ